MARTRGICSICKKRQDVTRHHIKELGKDENNSYHKMILCDECHQWHEKYVMALRDLGLKFEG